MKRHLNWIQQISFIAFSCALVSSTAFAAGHESSGGGDNYTLDFVKTANLFIYPWLEKNGNTLKPAVNADDFILSVDPKEIVSREHVFESCDGSKKGREVAACYSAKTGKTYLSRSLYPVNSDSPAKIGVVAHEVFRKMGIEGDDYEITKQMSIAQEYLIFKGENVYSSTTCESYSEAHLFADRQRLAYSVGVNLDHNFEGHGACRKALNQYYQSTSQPTGKVQIVRAWADDGAAANKAPDGTYCKNKDLYLGYFVEYCVIKVTP